MKGRKPTPSRLVALRGGTAYTHRPARSNVPEPPASLPPCPDHLDDAAREEWARVGNLLLSVRVMTDADRAVLALYCQAWSEWVQATTEARACPVTSRADGSPMLNLWMRVAREAADRVMRTAAELGLTPTARSRIKAEPHKSDEGKFAGLVG